MRGEVSLKIIVKYFRKYWVFTLMAPLFMLVEVYIDLHLPRLMATMVDDGINMGNLDLIKSLGIRMILLTSIGLLGGIGCAITSSFASCGLGADLRYDLFSKVQKLSNKNLDKFETGNLIVRLTNDVGQIEDVSRMMLRIMVRAPLQVIGSLILALQISRELSMLFVVFTPILVLTFTLVVKRSYPLFFKVQKSLDKLNRRLWENLSGMRVVKAYVMESFEERKFDQSSSELEEITKKSSRIVSLMNPLMQLIMNGSILLALYLGAELIDLKILRVGALIAFINYLRQLLSSLMMVSNLIMRLSRAQASSKRVDEVLNCISDVKEVEDPVLLDTPGGKIEFKDVSFRYSDSGDYVLKSISFVAEAGETIAIIGATGSGKTTITSLLSRDYNLDGGRILIDDVDSKEMKLKDLREMISLVPQKITLFSGTIRENILYGFRGESHKNLQNKMEEAATIANIDSFINSLPTGYETDVNQKGVNLSGGQKQRISIARAIAKEAPIIVFDDSTSAVDLETEAKIRSSLESLDRGQTTIIIAQKISSVLHADKIIVLEDGEIVDIGDHQTLLDKSEIYREIFNSQVGLNRLNHGGL